LFRVSTLDLANLPRTPEGKVDFAQDFFGREAFLTVSGRTCRTSDQLDQKLRPRKWLAQTDQRPKRLILRQQCLELEVPHRLVERFLLLVPRPQFRSLLLNQRNCCVTTSPTKS
jgi:hypothetical protein